MNIAETRPTRFPELRFAKLDDQTWRFVDTATMNLVGPHYKSKEELLADMDRYARDFGCGN